MLNSREVSLSCLFLPTDQKYCWISRFLYFYKLRMRSAIVVITFLVAAASLASLASSAALKPRDEAKNNQYPWYYWNMDGQQGQYPPYYMMCGAEGISSLNVLSLSVVGMTALAFTGIPQAPKTL